MSVMSDEMMGARCKILSSCATAQTRPASGLSRPTTSDSGRSNIAVRAVQLRTTVATRFTMMVRASRIVLAATNAGPNGVHASSNSAAEKALAQAQLSELPTDFFGAAA